MREGQSIHVLDGKGNEYLGTIDQIKRDRVLVGIEKLHRHTNQNWGLHLAISPTKQMSRIEWMLQKCTELGLDALHFFVSENAERPHLKIDRLQKIAISAMKQSGRAFLPQIHMTVNFSDMIEDMAIAEKYIAHCHKGEKVGVRDLPRGKQMLILIGPEGGFTSKEINLALTKRFRPLSLGEDRLRTETAGIYVTSVIKMLNE